MPLRTQERPNLPGEARPKRNSQRYQLYPHVISRLPLKMMDGDADYMIDSMDVQAKTSKRAGGRLLAAIVPRTRGKVLTTDGNTVGWTFVRTNNIENAATLQRIKTKAPHQRS